MASFWKTEACSQTVLPDRSALKGQKLVKMTKCQNSNATFWVIFKQCESPKGPSFFLLPSILQGFMSLWCGNLVGVAISSSTSFCGPFMKTLVKHCYTFLNIAIFIIIAVDPKWRATSSSLLFKTFSNLVKKMMSISKLDRKGIWKIDFSFLS